MKFTRFFPGIAILFFSITGHAQNVFEQYGFDKTPLTLSNGVYDEFFDNAGIVQIGTVLFNTKTNKVVGFVADDSVPEASVPEVSSCWLSPDPLAQKYPEFSPYVFCANNPVKYVDPDGRDWYQWQDANGNQAVLWQKGDATSITVNGQSYSNIGTTYTQQVTNNITMTYTQNEATSMTSTGLDKNEYVPQNSPTGCKVASDKMLANDGVNSQGERINVVNADANGVATSANGNASKGIAAVDNALENGHPIEVGVDYKSKQTGNIPPNGDGMTDHFIVVASKTETLSKGQVTSKTYNFFDPRNAKFGTDATNTLQINNNKLVGYYLGGSTMNIPYTVTTVRTSK